MPAPRSVAVPVCVYLLLNPPDCSGCIRYPLQCLQREPLHDAGEGRRPDHNLFPVLCYSVYYNNVLQMYSKSNCMFNGKSPCPYFYLRLSKFRSPTCQCKGENHQRDWRFGDQCCAKLPLTMPIDERRRLAVVSNDGQFWCYLQ